MCLQLVWFLFHLLSGLFSAPSEQLSPVLFTSLFSGEMWLHSSLWDLSWLFWGLPIIWHFFSLFIYTKSLKITQIAKWHWLPSICQFCSAMLISDLLSFVSRVCSYDKIRPKPNKILIKELSILPTSTVNVIWLFVDYIVKLSNWKGLFSIVVAKLGDIISPGEDSNSVPILAIIYAGVSSFNSVGVSIYQENLFKVNYFECDYSL